MSEHRATLSWERRSATFDYDTYNREHEWRFDNGLVVEASAAPEFYGRSGIDPEEAFVASVASCHMLTFLAIAARKRYVVDSYADAAIGTLDKNEVGDMAITTVNLFPKVVFSGPSRPSSEQLNKLHEKAHKHCFIANSIVSEVKVVL